MQTIKKIFHTFIFLLSMVGIVAVLGFVRPQTRIVREEIQVPVEVEAPTPSLSELIDEIPPRYGIPPIVVRAIIHQESNGKKNAIRFEQSQMGRAAKITSDPQQQRMLASSHGPMQILGWWSKEYQIDWSDLYDLRTNVEVGCAILKRGLDRHKGKGKYEQLRRALAEYNGSDVYAQQVLGRIGQELIEERL